MPLHDTKTEKRKEHFVSQQSGDCDSWIREQRRDNTQDGINAAYQKYEVSFDTVTKLFSVYLRRRTVDRTIRKPLTRFTKQLFQRRQIAVTIGPGDVISFRMKGCRKVTTVPIERVYRTALWLEASAAANKRRAERAANRKAARS